MRPHSSHRWLLARNPLLPLLNCEAARWLIGVDSAKKEQQTEFEYLYRGTPLMRLPLGHKVLVVITR